MNCTEIMIINGIQCNDFVSYISMIFLVAWNI